MNIAHNLVQYIYSSESIGELVKNPQDRAAVVKELVEKHGGRLHCLYFCFGQYDGMAIIELPDNVSMASVSMAVGATGAATNFHTTTLLTTEVAMEAMKNAGRVDYQPPTS